MNGPFMKSENSIMNPVSIGAVHKRRHQPRGRGLPKGDFSFKAYLVKVMTKGGQNLKKLMTSFMNGP